MKRRDFLISSGKVFLGGVATTVLPTNLLWGTHLEEGTDDLVHKLTLLHTNDTHSRIEPFPIDGGKFQGLGGVARRASLIKEIRKQEKNILLVDAGDIWQGTPYFNYFGGELEYKLMSEMGYDAATLGNHDFDAGIEGLVKQLPHAKFPFINANYDFSKTLMANKTQPYKVFQKGGIKIGILGVGIELDGLVPPVFIGKTRYNDPIVQANKTAEILKKKEKCNLIVCLSHLGYEFPNDKVSDKILAQKSKNIDIIIGGHTHTLMEKPDTSLKNLEGQEVLITQVGWAGIVLGRLDIYFDKKLNKKCIYCDNTIINPSQK